MVGDEVVGDEVKVTPKLVDMHARHFERGGKGRVQTGPYINFLMSVYNKSSDEQKESSLSEIVSRQELGSTHVNMGAARLKYQGQNSVVSDCPEEDDWFSRTIIDAHRGQKY